jgi:hypothetical protein
MTPRTEFSDLLTRSRRLIDAVLLFVITFALLIVAIFTLLCTVWITAFVMGRSVLERATVKATVERGATFNVL